jgi:cytoskeletal protein RodZ
MEPTLGQKLKALRLEREISLEEIAETTHIRLAYLQAIEEGDLENLPSPVQMRGFIRLYAATLGVEFEDLQVKGYHLTELQEDADADAEAEGEEEGEQDETDTDALSEVDEAETPPTSQAEDEPEPEADDKFNTEPAPAPPSDESPEQPIPEPSKPIADEEPRPNEARLIFLEIGEMLQQRRDLLSLSLDDVEKHTHVRKHYIELIEAGEFGELPSPVQARGMLANYAEFLNLDVDAILLYYAEGLQKQLHEIQISKPKKSPARALSPNALKLKNFFSLDLLVMAGIFLVFATFVIWGVNRILSAELPDPAATELPEVVDVLLATDLAETATPDAAEMGETTGTPGEDDATEGPVEPTPLFTPVANTNPINLVILPRHNTWVQVYTDYELVFEGRMLSGNAYDYSAEVLIEINTGNAGSLQIYFNDQDIGTIGLIGEVADLVFTENGLVQPTPTPSPTPTMTPEVTPTPTPTPTGTDDQAN